MTTTTTTNESLEGCAHCNNPLFAGVKCKNCGRVFDNESREAMEPVAYIEVGADGYLDVGSDREENEVRNRLGIGKHALVPAAQLATVEAARDRHHAELLALHEIIMCPGACPPIADTDTLTVRTLKSYIAAVDKRIATLQSEKAELAARLEGARVVLKNIKPVMVRVAKDSLERVAVYPADEIDDITHTLTTGNAVKQLEARVYRAAADVCDALATTPRERFSFEICSAELRKIAEQRETKPCP